MFYKRVVTTITVTNTDSMSQILAIICDETRTCQSCPFFGSKHGMTGCAGNHFLKNDPDKFLELAGFEEVEDEK